MSISNLFGSKTNYYDIQFETGIVEKDLTVNGQIIILGGQVLKGQIKVDNTTPSVDSSSGAIVVAGGVGFGENLNVTGDIRCNNIYTANVSTTHIEYETIDYVTGTNDATDASSGSLIVSGGSGIAKTLQLGGNFHALSADNTSISSHTVGSIICAGGMGIAKDINVHGTIYGSLYTTTINSTDASTGSFVVNGGMGINKNICVGALTRTNTCEITAMYSAISQVMAKIVRCRVW